MPIDKELKATELRHILYDSDATVLLTESPYLELLQDLLAGRSSQRFAGGLGEPDSDSPVAGGPDRGIEVLARSAFRQLCSPTPREGRRPALDFLTTASKHLATWIRKGRVQP